MWSKLLFNRGVHLKYFSFHYQLVILRTYRKKKSLQYCNCYVRQADKYEETFMQARDFSSVFSRLKNVTVSYFIKYKPFSVTWLFTAQYLNHWPDNSHSILNFSCTDGINKFYCASCWEERQLVCFLQNKKYLLLYDLNAHYMMRCAFVYMFNHSSSIVKLQRKWH